MKENVSGKKVVYADAISGVIGGQHFHIHVMKDPNYTMRFMVTYGTLDRSGNEIKHHFNGDMVRFKYQDIVRNHYT